MKTVPTDASVTAFLEAVPDERKRADAFALLDLMREATGEEPRMWGPSIVGFGTYHYRYPSGREGDMFLAGFSPRKGALSLYIMAGFDEYEELMARLGKHSTGKACLYVKRLSDVDLPTLAEIVCRSAGHVRATNS